MSLCSADGQPIAPPAGPDFLLRVAQGLVPGWSFVEKFGQNNDVNGGPEDVWSGGGLYTYSTSDDIDSISSSNVADTQQIVVIGHNNQHEEITQTVTLNGQNRVALSTPLLRVYRAYNISGTDALGDIWIYVNTALNLGVPIDPTKRRAKIGNASHPIPPNQTEMALYTIPKNREGWFYGGYVSMNSAQAGNYATFVWRLRPHEQVFRVQSRIACLGPGSSHWSYHYDVPVGPIVARTDIVISVDITGTSNTGCAGGFTLLLKEV